MGSSRTGVLRDRVFDALINTTTSFDGIAKRHGVTRAFVLDIAQDNGITAEGRGGQECSKCGAIQARRSKTGLCQTCFNACRPKEFTEKCTAALIAKLRHDPVYKQQCVDRLRMLARSEEGRERSRQRAKDMGLYKIGQQTAATPEALERRGRSVTRTKLAHVPSDYRDLYRFLVKKRKVKAADALVMVKEQQAKDLATFRASVRRD